MMSFDASFRSLQRKKYCTYHYSLSLYLYNLSVFSFRALKRVSDIEAHGYPGPDHIEYNGSFGAPNKINRSKIGLGGVFNINQY